MRLVEDARQARGRLDERCPVRPGFGGIGGRFDCDDEVGAALFEEERAEGDVFAGGATVVEVEVLRIGLEEGATADVLEGLFGSQ